MSTDDATRESINFFCRHCNAHSHSEVLATEVYAEVDESDGNLYCGPLYRYRLVRCAACDDLSLLIAMDGGGGQYDDDEAVYPAPPRRMSGAVPKMLQECFSEARACYEASAYTASAIMSRRSLELLAHDRGVKERDLMRSLKKLKEDGHIDQRLYDWCDELRLAGNKAVHDADSTVSKADARDMNDLTEAIIDYVYVFQARYENFKKRRGSQS